MPLPDCMPIVRDRLTRGDYRRSYAEPELTSAVDLCDARGLLNPQAVGWSRRPLVRANLSGHWLRKKRWNFWNWICDGWVLTITLADIDYAAFCSVAFSDFESGESASAMSLGRPGRFAMPEHVEQTVVYRDGALDYANVQESGRMKVDFSGRTRDGTRIEADFEVETPKGQESLNVVVPWSARRFQLNSKHNTLPCRGHVTVGDRRYPMEPENCHAVQDFGRGVWPYRSFWNWGVCTGVQGGDRIGVNVGARWTTGTGVNENGILFNGRLYKVMEDLEWTYDPRQPSRPWRVRSICSDAIDLVLEPVHVHRSDLDLGIVRSGGACAFGRWTGTVCFENRRVEIDGLIGWAEEFAHRW